MRKPPLYLLFTLLAAVDTVALLLAASPRVSAAYRAYYIERSTDCWPTEVAGTLPSSGRVWFSETRVEAPARAVLNCGWTSPQQTGVWSIGQEARLVLKPQGTGPWAVDFDIMPFVADSHPRQRVRISAGSTTLSELELRRGSPISHRLVIPSNLADPDGRILLVLALPDHVSPMELGYGLDRRELAVRLLSMQVTPSRS